MVLLAFAGLCLAIALALAWLLGVTLFFPEGALSKLIADRQNLVRAHIDYLMMSQFLLIFSLLFRQYAIDPPLWLLGAICYGAFFNPLGFLLRAFTRKPSGDALSNTREPHFPIQAAVSFSCATVGFLAAVALAVIAAWRLW
jgi:hypothetical protein